VKLGDTFRFDDSSEDGGHLFVVISDPQIQPDKVLVTSVTTLHEGVRDRSCVIEAGEHPQIRRRSCMFYDDTYLTTARRLAQFAAWGDVVVHEPFDLDLMERVWEGAVVSAFFKYEYRELLDSQGLTPGFGF
jgi:hypothetical protein